MIDPFYKLAHSTTPAFIEELSTWKRADPTTKNKNKPRTTGPTGIFSSRLYNTDKVRYTLPEDQ